MDRLGGGRIPCVFMGYIYLLELSPRIDLNFHPY